MSDLPPSKTNLDDTFIYPLCPLPSVEQRISTRIHHGVEAIERSLTSTLKQLTSVAPAAADNTRSAIAWAYKVLPIWTPKLLANLALELVQAGQRPSSSTITLLGGYDQ